MNTVSVHDAGKRYRRRWALRHCSLEIPEGSVVGLVGANGAGKTTLLHLLVGLLTPSEGVVRVCGDVPASGPDTLARVGFLAQDAPLYTTFTVDEHLRLGRELNPTWDDDLARHRITRLAIELDTRVGRLSGGQRSQLALTLAIAKRPQLLVLDEPMASLDPLARREFLADLMTLVAEHRPTVILSSHSLTEVERACDHLVVISEGRVGVDGPVDELLATHRVLTGPRASERSLPTALHPVQVRQSERQTTMVVRTSGPILDPRWSVAPVGLEELVLAYMSGARPAETTHLAAVAS